VVSSSPGCTLPPVKTRYPFYRRLGGPQGRPGRAENLVPTGIRSWTIQPIAQSLYRLSYPAHSQIRDGDQFPSLSLCTTGTTPQCQMLFLHPAFQLSYILPRNPQERLRSNKLPNRTVPCELVGDFISSHSSMPQSPI